VVTPFFHGLLLLTVLGAAVFVAVAVRGTVSILAVVAGFLTSSLMTDAQRLPDPVWVGTLAVLIGALQLFRPRYALLTAFAGGVLAGLCGPLAGALGILSPIGSAFGAAEASLVAYFAIRRKEFAPLAMQEEALLGIVGLGTLVALIPGVLSGWQSAVALNIEDKGDANLMVPAWTLTLGATAAACGGLYSLWRHR
jgi:hypothetical protein